ncbi:hypothetical protein [Clostridium estertheticum]|nr:hypothetical protein [Clostridium estertheticum]
MAKFTPKDTKVKTSKTVVAKKVVDTKATKVVAKKKKKVAKKTK